MLQYFCPRHIYLVSPEKSTIGTPSRSHERNSLDAFNLQLGPSFQSHERHFSGCTNLLLLCAKGVLPPLATHSRDVAEASGASRSSWKSAYMKG